MVAPPYPILQKSATISTGAKKNERNQPKKYPMFWNRGEHCGTLGAGEKPENKKQDSLSKPML